MKLAHDEAMQVSPRPASDTTIAMDRASVRSFDTNGRMRVEQANISKANVCPYLGSEIVGYEELGLDPKKVYQLLRDPAALEAGAASFNGIPILDTHVPSTAWDHPAGKVVGTTGTDAVFEAPHLKNSLVIWTQDAIDDIESREKQELSCGYTYRPIMEPGTYDGVQYDGRMVDILGNHVALVAAGRAGPDVIVGDSQLEIKETGMTKKALSPMAQLVKGALMAALKPGVLAKDAKFDYGLLTNVTKANWAEKRPGIIAAIKPKLAADAALEDIVKLVDALEKTDGTEDAEPMEAPAIDADPVKAIMDMFKAKGATDEEVGQVGELMKKVQPAAKDAEPEEKKGGDDDKDKDEKTVTPEAMDAALKAERQAFDGILNTAVAKARTDTIAHMNAIAEAREKVTPFVGKLATAFDSAEAVYRAALKQLSVPNADTIHASALPALLEALPKPGTVNKTHLAADAAVTKSFEDKYGAVRVL